MPLRVIFVSGPRRSGKTTLMALLARQVFTRPAHWLRLVPDDMFDVGLARPSAQDDRADAPAASRRDVHYTASRVFEAVSESLREVRRRQRYATVLVEGDSDSSLRHAYPYDDRIFVMPLPADVHEVFRTASQAARALRQVMQDTASFASEIFGLFDDELLDPDPCSSRTDRDRLPSWLRGEPRAEVSESQLRAFLASPLGAEIASRIQLQPPYHGLVESDVIVVNAAVGGDGPAGEECLRRLELLLSRVRRDACRMGLLYCCDPLDTEDPIREKLLARLTDLIQSPAP